MDAAGHKVKLLDQLYFNWWRLAADIPVAAGFICYLFSFEPEYIFFIIQCTLITDCHSLRHIRCHIDFCDYAYTDLMYLISYLYPL